MTTEQFDKLPSGTVFQKGVSFLGDKKIFYVCVKYYPFWSMYYSENDLDAPGILRSGVKASKYLAQTINSELIDLYND